VGRWRERYARDGMGAIERDLPRVGVGHGGCGRDCAPDYADHATQCHPLEYAHLGGGGGSKRHGLKPHLIETFKVSRDPEFVEKLEDVVGLYLHPPEHALVLCCDEKKSQVQRWIVPSRGCL
jgi:hypothetical protein